MYTAVTLSIITHRFTPETDPVVKLVILLKKLNQCLQLYCSSSAHAFTQITMRVSTEMVYLYKSHNPVILSYL